MKPIAKLTLTGDLEDLWYLLTEPDGKRFDWDHAYQALEFAEKQGWEVEWVAKQNDKHFQRYIPEQFRMKEGVE